MANENNENNFDTMDSGDGSSEAKKLACNSTAMEQNQSALSDLHTRKKQLDYFIHDLQIEKSRYNRMVRSMVKMLQHEILTRGRTLAKEIDQVLDERIQQASESLQRVTGLMDHLSQDEKQPSTDNGEESVKSTYYDYDISSLPLPCRDPFFIDMKQVVAVLQDLKVTTQEYVEEPFPEREEFIKAGVEVDVSGVGFWDSQRPTFYLMPRHEEQVSFLYRHSQNIRMTYLSDKTWQTYQDSQIQPTVGSPVFACHPDDRCWYRALVTKNLDQQGVSSVKFIDYGETKPVPWSDLLPSRKELYSDAKPWAFECTLAEDIDLRRCQDARWFFNSTLYEITRSCVPLKCTPIKQVEVAGSLVWLVHLTVAHSDGSIMDLSKEVKDKLSLAKPQSTIACRDIREEYQKQLSDIEKERELKKAQQEKENQQKQAETGNVEGRQDSSEKPSAEPSDKVQEMTSGHGQVTSVSTNLVTPDKTWVSSSASAQVPSNETTKDTQNSKESQSAVTAEQTNSAETVTWESKCQEVTSGPISTAVENGEGTAV